jgi:glucokinase
VNRILMKKISEPKQRHVLAADLGGTHLRVAIVNSCGQIVTQVKQPTPRDSSDPEIIVRAIVAAAERCVNEGESHRPAAACIVVPGAVDVDNAFVVQAPNLPSLTNFGLKSALETRLGLNVVLENDANAAAVGEMWLGAAKGCRDVISVTLGTGVGGGIILNGVLWRGAHGSGGEVGHTTVDPLGGLKCKCGNSGCLELFASATAISRMTKALRPEFPNTMLKGDELTAEMVYDAGKANDELALSVFRQFGMYLGIGIANLINLLDPEIIVIAGGVVNGWTMFEKVMRDQVNERSFRLAASRVRIAPAECGDNAGLLGAAKLALDTCE